MQLDFGFEDERIPPACDIAGALTPGEVLHWLEGWYAAGWLRLLDLEFARFLYRERPDADGRALLLAALVSHQLGRGHVCLDLDAAQRGPERVLNLPPAEEVRPPIGVQQDTLPEPPISPAELLTRLAPQNWAALAGNIISDGSVPAPLVHEAGRFYLYRYWRYEWLVAEGVAHRLVVLPGQLLPEAESVKALLTALFGPPAQQHSIDWQRLACALAARQRFAVITGGPGTGKTTTVVRLLALLQALTLDTYRQASAGARNSDWQPLRIRLAAPTGKAAARLGESIRSKVGELPLDRLGGGSLHGTIPTEVVTLHRLLGARPHVRKRRYNADNLLPLDVLVVDEASMVSLSDMADLFAALPAHARLILIGDKDQLSSVEAGSVLGELCQRAAGGHYVQEVVEWLSNTTGQAVPDELQDAAGRPLDQAVAMLRFSHRFGDSSGIGRLALAVNSGDVSAVKSLLAVPPHDLSYLEPGRKAEELDAGIVVEGYGQYLAKINGATQVEDPVLRDAWALDVLRAHRRFQVLCVVRHGPWGVAGLNAAIARTLHSRGMIPSTSGWYAGRPIMVTRNNPALRLTNGDIGLALPLPAPDGGTVLRVAFADGEGEGVRWFSPNRLDDVETVYALTVHKSQGSEFEHAVLALPSAPTPVLSRELLYTGITRASRRFTLVNPGGESLLELAVQQRVHRSSGLGDLISRLS